MSKFFYFFLNKKKKNLFNQNLIPLFKHFFSLNFDKNMFFLVEVLFLKANVYIYINNFDSYVLQKIRKIWEKIYKTITIK